jgi:hypothetical protein
MGKGLTVHCFLVDLIDSVISVDDILVFLLWLLDLADLIVIVDEIAKRSEIGRDGWVWW